MERYESSHRGLNVNKEQKLNNARQEVEHIVDKLGKGIDEGIKETIAVLRAMDFPTSSSCAGHTDHDHYCPPYVEIYASAPEGWKEDKEKQELWRAENLKNRDRFLQLLNEFNKQRNVIEDAQLEVWNLGIYGGFRLQAKGTNMKMEELGIKTREDIFNKIKLYQNEMSAFTEFIRKAFPIEK